ncbi:hypothetical protein BD410DRAFT_724190 [Rickenella mellea]|uniref:J domain-containing protein n=1 Tax=Rickenella mellea TaxID=50990 RepID=A0A4Y7Q3V2_9AGAM|nr:hypothetical protein BD410DRAFT_724190 [Rickenella mellea]
MNKGQVAKSWAGYETWWSTVGQRGALHFHTISWPIFTSAKTPEDLTTASIALFVLSPHHSNGKSAKDRIKEQLLRWHPDRFEGKWLPLVPDEEKSIVREGMGQVVRALNELLNRES